MFPYSGTFAFRFHYELKKNHSKLGHNSHLPKHVLMKTNSEMHTSPESCRGTVIYQRGFWNGFPRLLPDTEQISNFQGCGSIDQAIP